MATTDTHRLHLDPRTKLLMLVLFSLIVMIDVADGPAAVVRGVMTFVPVALIVAEGKPHIGVWFTLLFVAAMLLTEMAQDHFSGAPGMIVLFLCYIVTQFAPVMMMVWYALSTTTISEWMAALHRLHAPQGLTISIAVMMRFFPTLAEEYRAIRDAMRMRGIGLGGGKPTKMVEYRLVPLLFSSVSIGDELSAAAVTRGLGAPVVRTNVCNIGFHWQDALLTLLTAGLALLYLLFSYGG